MIPGEESDHANFYEPAVDIMIIGDEKGRVVDDQGQEINPTATLEMQWIIHYGPDFGFYHPYPPKLEDPLGSIGPKGVLVEDWHIKFVRQSEAAEILGDKVHSREAFKKRAAALGHLMLV
jgi:hypothetical protein